MGYTYAMSDLHGSLSQFRQMLSLIGFSGEDRLYLIGDVFDRKPDAMALLMDVMKRENVTLLLGNHEHMMIDYVEDRLGPLQKASWLDRSGGHYTLAGFQALSSWERSLVMGYLNTRCPVFLNRVRCGERRPTAMPLLEPGRGKGRLSSSVTAGTWLVNGQLHYTCKQGALQMNKIGDRPQ